MSKKNNKSRTKAYVDALKEEEKRNEEERVLKEQEKKTKRIEKDVLEEIKDMDLTGQAKENKMELEPAITKKKKKFAKKMKSKK
jgi:hypothetical protein